MLTIEGNEAEAADADTSESGALTPLCHEREPGVRRRFSVRPDSSFVAQLIATAEQLPQTRKIRRAAAADALSAYARSSHQRTPSQAGRTRHII